MLDLTAALPSRDDLNHEVADVAERWRVAAAVADQRMDTAVVYWEGLVWVFDATGTRVGTGYMELTGYAGRMGEALY